MTKLNELIQQLCPDGVKYYTLNTVCNVYDGTHKTPKYTDSGIKFASVENIANPYATEKYISISDYEKYKIKPQRNDLLMTRIGSIGVCTVIESDEPLAYYVSLALLRPDNSILNSRYLKYAIESLHCRKELRKRTLVNAVPIKKNMGDIGKITLPVPPLPVQSEIVRILDNFTEITQKLTTELAAELIARKQQYEYYRNRLLAFDDRGGGQVELNGGCLAKPVFSKLVKRLMPRVFLRKRRWNTASPATEETDCVDMCAKQIRKEKNHSLVGRVLYAGMFALQKAIIMLRNTLLL